MILNKWARWSHLARLRLPAVSRKQNFPESHMINLLLTKCEVKMAGYWPSSFFASYLWTEIKSRSINSQRTNEANTNKLNLVNKRFIIWLSGKFCLQDTAGSPKRARWLHLAHFLRITLQSGVAMTFIQETRLE